MIVANGDGECFLADNSFSRDSRLFGLRPPQSGNRRFGFGSDTRRTVSGAHALIAGRGSNPLSTSVAGEDELNDDGFGRLAPRHLAYPRNESGIRRSRFVLSPKMRPLFAAFCGTAFLGSGQQSRESRKPDHELDTPTRSTFLQTSRREAPYK